MNDMAHGKTPSLADLLRSKDAGNEKSTSQPSLADLLAMSPTRDKTSNSSGFSSLKYQETSKLPSLIELSQQNKKQCGTEGTSSSENGQSLKSLLTTDCSKKANSNSCSSLPSLNELLKNTPSKSGSFQSANESASRQKENLPNLASLLQGIDITSTESKQKQVDLKNLASSMDSVSLSDLATTHVRKSSPQRPLKLLSDKTNTRRKLVVPYKKKVSAFGQILGAQYQDRGNRGIDMRLQDSKDQFDIILVYTEEMLGAKNLTDVYSFNEPSPDDVVKRVQNKAFERDSR